MTFDFDKASPQHIPAAIIERFWSHVTKGAGCWEWNAYRAKNGYGRFGVNQKLVTAHRFAWFITNGGIPLWAPPDRSTCICVLHRCDNRRCVNPSHLFLGTNKDNVLDMHRKGRAVFNVEMLRKLAALQGTKERCKRGHPFTEKRNSRGYRQCQECKNMLQRIRWSENRDLRIEYQRNYRRSRKEAAR